jgi:hypothetical protein
MVRFFPAIFAAIAGAMLLSQAAAQTPSTLLPGTTGGTLMREASAWCAVERGPSTFKRINTNPADMSFAKIFYTPITQNVATYYALSGSARLTFAGATQGTITFQPLGIGYPGNVVHPQFTQYSQNFDVNTGVLNVAFMIKFPQCKAKVKAVYQN